MSDLYLIFNNSQISWASHSAVHLKKKETKNVEFMVWDFLMVLSIIREREGRKVGGRGGEVVQVEGEVWETLQQGGSEGERKERWGEAGIPSTYSCLSRHSPPAESTSAESFDACAMKIFKKTVK